MSKKSLLYFCSFAGVLSLVVVLFFNYSKTDKADKSNKANKTERINTSKNQKQNTKGQVLQATSIPAFPGAEGFGANTPGGRGGRVIEVTNLNDSGSGSLRACIEASGPRICVFRTGGTINLSSALTITSPYITIAGQTAPGGGITLKNNPSNGSPSIIIRTHDVILRYLAVRPGPSREKSSNVDAITMVDGVNNVIVDHSSFSWATDEVVNTWYDARNITIQWSIASEGLNCSTHAKGCHSKGVLFGDEAGGSITFHHNLMAHNQERNPMVSTGIGTIDVVNNVMYNYGWGLMSYDQYNNRPEINAIANYFIPGDNTPSYRWEITTHTSTGAGHQIYLQGNIGPHRSNDSLPEEALAYSREGSVSYTQLKPGHPYRAESRHPAPQVTTTSAFEAYDQVLAGAGANMGFNCDGSYFLRRDAIDQRIVNDVKNGTGKIIDDPSDVGGWLNIAPGTPCTDTDHDGMADEWELAHFGNLSQGSASNSSSNYDGDGYTDLEEFLNGTNPKGGSLTPTPTPTPTPTSSPNPSHCPPLGDIDCSGKVNGIDFGHLMAHWGTADPQANLDDIGV